MKGRCPVRTTQGEVGHNLTTVIRQNRLAKKLKRFLVDVAGDIQRCCFLQLLVWQICERIVQAG